MVKASFWWYEKIMTFTRSELKWNTFSLRFPSIDFGKKTQKLLQILSFYKLEIFKCGTEQRPGPSSAEIHWSCMAYAHSAGREVALSREQSALGIQVHDAFF